MSHPRQMSTPWADAQTIKDRAYQLQIEDWADKLAQMLNEVLALEPTWADKKLLETQRVDRRQRAAKLLTEYQAARNAAER